MKTELNEQFSISPFFVFFLIYSNIVGVGVMSYQREIIKGAGYDAWIAIILSGLRTLMYKTEYVSPGCALRKRTYSNR